ncbi:MAG: hypothetical protein H6912_05505 [Kordiimonadaceae bacterium]|nr:hypothetical protein [Kordiimonadaceae bacterium]
MSEEQLNEYIENEEQLIKVIHEKRKNYSFKRILNAYSLFGLLISIFAFGYFLFSLFDFQLTENQQLSLMIAGVGLALSLMSRAMLVYSKQKESERKELDLSYYDAINIILLWSEFEKISKNKLDELRVSYNKHSISEIISGLIEYSILSHEDRLILDDIRLIRNRLAHGNSNYSNELIVYYKNILLSIMDKIAEFEINEEYIVSHGNYVKRDMRTGRFTTPTVNYVRRDPKTGRFVEVKTTSKTPFKGTLKEK